MEQQNMMKKMMQSAMNGLGKGGLVEYKGRIFMPGISMACVEHLQNWDMPENSVIISSFPKTGTAWCTQIVCHILCGEDEDDELLERYQSIPMPLLGLEMGPKMKYEFLAQMPLPRKYFATHVAEEFFNFEKMKQSKSKMIYVIRNPKDQAVSWFHFSKKIPVDDETRKSLGEEWNEFYSNYLNGEHPMGLRPGEFYPDHILGWLKHKDDKDFLIVVYEDMKKDFCKEIQRIANFLEVELTDENVRRIAENCSINSMKKAAETEKSGFLKMNVRKGEVGGWKDQMTVTQSELMDKAIQKKLGKSGIEFTYTF